MGDEPFKSDLITLNSVSNVFKISLLKQVWHLTKKERTGFRTAFYSESGSSPSTSSKL